MPFARQGGCRSSAWLLALLLTILSLAVSWPVRRHAFTFDDHAYIEENRHVRQGLSRSNIGWAFTTFHQSNWHPVTWVSHLIDVELHGLDPRGHHETNAILHAANGALLFLFFAALTGSALRSAALAALFALHPLHVESVAWVSERKDLLSAFFLALTLLSYLGYQRRHGWKPYLLTVTMYALGLMAKPMLVTLPFALLLLDYWPLGRMPAPLSARRLAPLLREKAPLFLMAAASCLVTFVAQQRGEAVQTTDMIPIAQRLSNVFVAYPTYLAKTLWPADLAVFYPHAKAALSRPAALAGGAVLALLSVAAVRLRRPQPFFLVGWLWFLGTLVPVIGLVQVGDQALADRYTYIPLIGIFLILTWTLFPPAASARGRRLSALALVVMMSALAMITREQLGHWRNDVTLFSHALEVTTDNWAAHDGMGNALAAQGRLEDALREYRRMLQLRPTYAEGYNNLGTVLARLGRRREAMGAFRSALLLKDTLARANGNLGLALAEEGRPREALHHLRKAVELDSCAANALTNLGNLLDAQGLSAEAEQRYRQAIDCEPDFPGAYYNLAVLQVRQGRSTEAAANLSIALRLRPDHPGARALLQGAGQIPRH
jgi:tetratricopeptide (TPR) repeat protein